jgi:undecaprenyl diphosphate synthase
LVNTLIREVDDLAEKRVRLRAIGDLSALPAACQTSLQAAVDRTEALDGLDLILALSYSSKWELVEAVRQIIRDGLSPEAVDADLISSRLSTRGLPDPELMIRTSGEHRISNFMLWQLAYAEFHFTSVLWPDFRKAHFFDAIRDFQRRDRRFGGVLHPSVTGTK